MDTEQFREFGKAAVDYLANYVDSLRTRKVLPSVQPGYLKELIPDEAPEDPESWQDFMKDMDKIIMPGMTHWASPQFHAFFAAGNSFPSVVGEMLCAGLGTIGFSWFAGPACTELEVEMMNWLGKLMNLPKEFLNCSKGPGGGVIQGSASESTLIGMLAAKERMLNKMLRENPKLDPQVIRSKLVAYTSEESNSSVEKSGLLAAVPMRLLPSDEYCVFRGETLSKAIEEDKAKGLIPCYVVANLGTTGTCAFDNLEELGVVCEKEGLWLHIDAAYAGTALICPEYRHLMKGIDYADSFNFNPHKWMLVNFDCSAMWVKDANFLVDAFDVQRIYLANNMSGCAPDLRHWQIPLGRRFRSLKLWAVLRMYGASGIRKHVRNHVSLANYFESLVLKDSRFEVVCSSMGLVCFRIKGDNTLSENLLNKLTERKNIYLISCICKDKYVIRFVVCSRLCEKRDVDFAWEEIRSQADEVLTDCIIEEVAEGMKMSSENMTFEHSMTMASFINEKTQ